jgi:hypothetical protein
MRWKLGHYPLLWYLLAAIVALAIVILLRSLRRKTLAFRRFESRSYDFDLVDLEKLVANGQMTAEEYHKARAVILARSDASFEPAKGFPVLAPLEQPKADDKKS